MFMLILGFLMLIFGTRECEWHSHLSPAISESGALGQDTNPHSTGGREREERGVRGRRSYRYRYSSGRGHGHARLGEGRDRVGVRASPRGLLSGLLSGR